MDNEIDNDPLDFLNLITSNEQRSGFELGLMYADMLVDGLGPWIVQATCAPVVGPMAARLGLVATVEPYTELDSPVPMVVVTCTPKPRLRLV